MSDVRLSADDLCSSWMFQRPASASDEVAVSVLRDVEGAGGEERRICLCHERQGSIEQIPFIMRRQQSWIACRQEGAYRVCVRGSGDPHDVGHHRDCYDKRGGAPLRREIGDDRIKHRKAFRAYAKLVLAGEFDEPVANQFADARLRQALAGEQEIALRIEAFAQPKSHQ